MTWHETIMNICDFKTDCGTGQQEQFSSKFNDYHSREHWYQYGGPEWVMSEEEEEGGRGQTHGKEDEDKPHDKVGLDF